MSHDPTGKSDVHAEKGGEGVAMAWGHKGLRWLAELFAHSPRIVALVRTLDPTGGTGAGAIIRTLAGGLNAPLAGLVGAQWAARLNALFDTFAFEVSEIFEKDADKPIDEILGDKALMDTFHQRVDHFLDKKVWLVLEQAHDDQSCTIYSALTASETYIDKKDGNKEKKRPPKHVPTELTLERAVKEKRHLCPICFPAGDLLTQKHHAPKKEPSKKVSPMGICGAYITEAPDEAERIAREAKVQQLLAMIAAIPDEQLRRQIDGLNTRAELEGLLAAMVAGSAALEHSLEQLEEPGMARTVGKLAREIRAGVESFVSKADAAAAEEIKDIDARTTAVRRRMSERVGGEILDEHGAVVGNVSQLGRLARFWRALTDGIV